MNGPSTSLLAAMPTLCVAPQAIDGDTGRSGETFAESPGLECGRMPRDCSEQFALSTLVALPLHPPARDPAMVFPDRPLSPPIRLCRRLAAPRSD